jgi:hypothetical protein
MSSALASDEAPAAARSSWSWPMSGDISCCVPAIVGAPVPTVIIGAEVPGRLPGQDFQADSVGDGVGDWEVGDAEVVDTEVGDATQECRPWSRGGWSAPPFKVLENHCAAVGREAITDLSECEAPGWGLPRVFVLMRSCAVPCCRRLRWEYQRFLTALSVRPGSSFEISSHLFPQLDIAHNSEGTADTEDSDGQRAHAHCKEHCTQQRRTRLAL